MTCIELCPISRDKLLGIASGQEMDIKAMKLTLGEMKVTLSTHTTLLNEILARLPEKPTI